MTIGPVVTMPAPSHNAGHLFAYNIILFIPLKLVRQLVPSAADPTSSPHHHRHILSLFQTYSDNQPVPNS
jgi:hypothetical protein